MNQPAAVSRRTVLVGSLASATAAYLLANGGRALAAPNTGPISVEPASYGAVFVDEHRQRFVVSVQADKVTWTVRDVWGNVVRTGTAHVRNGRATVEARTDDGYFVLDVVATRGTKEVARHSTSFAVLAPYRLPADSPFGANTHLPPLESVPLMVALGIKWARVDLTWTEVEPPPLSGWTPDIHDADATVELDTTVARSGKASMKLVNRSPRQDNVYATVTQLLFVRPNTTYVAEAWVKGKDVSVLEFTVRPDWGARVAAPRGTYDWTRVRFEFTTAADSFLTFRLLSSDVTGAAWLDDLRVRVAGSNVNVLSNPGFERGLITGYDFATYEPFLDSLKRARIHPLPIVDYANPKYDDGLTPHTDAGQAAFAAYSAATVKRFRQQFSAIEVFNEPNGTWFTTGPAAGDPEYYAALLEKTYKAVKAVDPSIVVVGGATFGTALEWMTAVFEAGGMAHLDAVSNHPYVGVPESPDPIDAAEREATALIERYNGGKAKPVWATELGWSLGDGLTAAGYLVRGLVLSLAGGVEKFFWYDLIGDQNYGLVNEIGVDDFTPRPVFAAYAVAIRQLTGRKLRGEHVAGAIRQYTFDDVSVLWTTDARTSVAVPTQRPLDIVDTTGGTTRLTPVDGKVHLTLTGAPVYVRTKAQVVANERFQVTAPPIVRTADETLTFTNVVDNTGGARSVDAVFTSLGRQTRVTAPRGQRVEKASAIPVDALALGRNIIFTSVAVGGRQAARLMTSAAVIEVPTGELAMVGTPDWTDHEFALAPGGYAEYPTRFPNDVTFTIGDDPARSWSYIHPGPDDTWAGGRAHTYTLNFDLTTVRDLRLLVFLLDTHNTAPGTAVVKLNGGTATTVALPAGGSAGHASGSALDSGDIPSQFTVPLPAAQLVAGKNTITIDKTTGSWMVYDAVGIYPA